MPPPAAPAPASTAAAKPSSVPSDDIMSRPWDNEGYANAGYELVGEWLQFESNVEWQDKDAEGPPGYLCMMGLVVGCQQHRVTKKYMHRMYVWDVRKVVQLDLEQRRWARVGYMRPYPNHKLIGKRIAMLCPALYDDLAMRALSAKRFDGKERAFYEAFVVDVKNREKNIYVVAYPVDDEKQIQFHTLTPGADHWSLLPRGVNQVDGLAVISWSGEVEDAV